MSKKVKEPKEVYVKFTDLLNLKWLIIDEIAHHSVLNKLTEKERKQLMIDMEEVFDKKAIFTGKEI
jgi:hypothetical protein